ncbi:MAG: hypothetical protein ABSA76_06970 [Bacteroidales bacterium]
MRSFFKQILPVIFLAFVLLPPLKSQDVPKDFVDPPREFSVMPFWFWNDTLKDDEIIRQIAGFEAHGVYGFIIHPRIGLPADMKWLSPEMIHSMGVAISEAAKRNMNVILYDEGMYPSGSSSGQVVGKNPAHAAHGLAKIDLKSGENPVLTEGMKLITIVSRPDGNRVAIVEQPSGGVIRGLHYTGQENARPGEETPAAGDILNPDAVTSFMDLVYEKYAAAFGKYFGNTILGIFTDEPSPLGRNSARGVVPGNASLLPQIKKILGYDITPFLTDLWYSDNSDSKIHRNDYYRAINTCLVENYYKRLGNWCLLHNISLMGHPAGSMDIGAERYFQIPGQDLVWRYVEPGPKALNGENSTVAKCASSAMLHMEYRRNLNELYGAYGHNLTYDEMVWLADWCFVRGQNLLIPHAFFYSIRGPRYDERPPDVGPNSAWWSWYKQYADACRRLSWLNTDSRQVCDIAILCDGAFLPDKPAKILFQHQHDFNYLEARHLGNEARISKKGIIIAGMKYKALIIDTIAYLPDSAVPLLKKLAKNKHLIVNGSSKYASWFKGALVYTTDVDLLNAVNRLTKPDLILAPPSENIRYRHVSKEGDDYYILFNEEGTDVSTGVRRQAEKYHQPATSNRYWLDPVTAKVVPAPEDGIIHFKPHELKVLWIPGIK